MAVVCKLCGLYVHFQTTGTNTISSLVTTFARWNQIIVLEKSYNLSQIVEKITLHNMT